MFLLWSPNIYGHICTYNDEKKNEIGFKTTLKSFLPDLLHMR